MPHWDGLSRSVCVISYLLSRCQNNGGGLFIHDHILSQTDLIVLVGLPFLLTTTNHRTKEKEE